MAIEDYPPIEYVGQCFVCDFENGELYWKNRSIDHFVDEHNWKIWNKRFPGKRAGWIGWIGRGEGRHPRWHVTINGKAYLRSLILWSLHNGRWPVCEVDHIDMDPSNDRIENLRECTKSQQHGNQGVSRNNTLGFKGIILDKRRGTYFAKIQVDGRTHSSSGFRTPREAAIAYDEMAVRYKGEFARTDAMMGLL